MTETKTVEAGARTQSVGQEWDTLGTGEAPPIEAYEGARKYHHFLMVAPRPANEVGFRFVAIGDGTEIYRWDRQKTAMPTCDERPHFLDSRIANWKSKSRLGYRCDFYSPFYIALTESRLDQWQGSYYTYTVAVIKSVTGGWSVGGKTYRMLLGAIRAALPTIAKAENNSSPCTKPKNAVI